jgi:hypothetical protein
MMTRTRFVIPETWPGITFGDEGVCGIYREAKEGGHARK